MGCVALPQPRSSNELAAATLAWSDVLLLTIPTNAFRAASVWARAKDRISVGVLAICPLPARPFSAIALQQAGYLVRFLKAAVIVTEQLRITTSALDVVFAVTPYGVVSALINPFELRQAGPPLLNSANS